MRPPPDRIFSETALFDDLDSASFSFAFELVSPSRTAFRLREIAEALAEQGRKWTDGKPDIFDRLIDPVRSFLDDVTTGPPGTNGRPLFFAASGSAPDDESRRVALCRPERWAYEFEGETTELIVLPERARFSLRLRDSFCAFESGRLYYVLTLTQPSDAPQPFDEYAVIQLQQLALAPARAEDRDYLGFQWADAEEPCSLVDLANVRLRALRKDRKGDVNGIVHVIEPFGLLANGERHEELSAIHLRGLCVGLESELLLACADHAVRRFPPQDPDAPPELPAALARREARWQARLASAKADGPPPHVEPDNSFDRSVLAFAGIAQGVPDFPDQDESEIHDSTRPSASSVEASLYVHPRFLLEVAKNWRSFNTARPLIGTCPYLLLTWMVALHDEAIVADMERRIDTMIYGSFQAPTNAEQRRTAFRAEPIEGLIKLMRSASWLFGQRTRLQQNNLMERLELFRWASIHRSGNIFRYPQEKGALAAVREAMGTEERFDDAYEMLDRYQALVENVSTLSSSYAERRIGRLLTILSLFGILAFPKMVQDFSQVTGLIVDPIVATALLVALPLAVYLFSRFGRR